MIIHQSAMRSAARPKAAHTCSLTPPPTPRSAQQSHAKYYICGQRRSFRVNWYVLQPRLMQRQRFARPRAALVLDDCNRRCLPDHFSDPVRRHLWARLVPVDLARGFFR